MAVLSPALAQAEGPAALTPETWGAAYEPHDIAGVGLRTKIGIHWPVGQNPRIVSAEVARKMKELGAGYSVILIEPGDTESQIQAIVSALRKENITPVARVVGSWTKRSVALWDVNSVFPQMLTQARIAAHAGIQLIVVGNEPNAETSDHGGPMLSDMTREEYLDKATANIVTALIMIREGLAADPRVGPGAFKLGLPPMAFGLPDANQTFSGPTFCRKLLEVLPQDRPLADWAATHAYIIQDDQGRLTPSDNGESIFGLPLLATEGGPGLWNNPNPQSYLEQMQAAYAISAQGIPYILWLEEIDTANNWHSALEARSANSFYNLGMAYYRERYAHFVAAQNKAPAATTQRSATAQDEQSTLP